jgi:hypothetical protein
VRATAFSNFHGSSRELRIRRKMRLDNLHGPTIDDFPGIFTSRLVLAVYVALVVTSFAVTIGVVVWALLERRRRTDGDHSVGTRVGHSS